MIILTVHPVQFATPVTVAITQEQAGQLVDQLRAAVAEMQADDQADTTHSA